MTLDEAVKQLEGDALIDFLVGFPYAATRELGYPGGDDKTVAEWYAMVDAYEAPEDSFDHLHTLALSGGLAWDVYTTVLDRLEAAEASAEA